MNDSPIILGKYALLERVAIGGMAEVFVAKEFGTKGFEKIVAIKRILPSMIEDQEFIAMFIDEARISLQLRHSNIVQMQELGRYKGAYYLAMDYVSGRDLRSILDRYQRLGEKMPVVQAAYIASKICEALDYAHRKKDLQGRDLNIVHRDVSPQNILIGYDGEVKLIDFGIAKASNRDQSTQAGILKGKFCYMSPEQVKGRPIDRRADVFAAGTLTFEMLAGEKLFSSDSVYALMEHIKNGVIPSLREINPAIPVELEQVILRALTQEPADRFQWASEFQQALLPFTLSQNSAYSARNLSHFIKEAFATEYFQEMQRIDKFTALTAEELDVEEEATSLVDTEALSRKTALPAEEQSYIIATPDLLGGALVSPTPHLSQEPPTASESSLLSPLPVSALDYPAMDEPTGKLPQQSLAEDLPATLSTKRVGVDTPLRWALLIICAVALLVLGGRWGRSSEGEVVVWVLPADVSAAIQVDGKDVQFSDNAAILSAGVHQVEVHPLSPSYGLEHQKIEIRAQELTQVRVMLRQVLPLNNIPSKSVDAGTQSVRTYVVTLNSIPAGATVWVDGKKLGITPTKLESETSWAGRAISLKKQGYKTASVTLPTKVTDLEQEQNFELEPRKKKPVAVNPTFAAEGYLVVTGVAPGIEVWVDGSSTGRKTPISEGQKLALPVGVHSVSFRLGKKKSVSRSIVIREDEIERISKVTFK